MASKDLEMPDRLTDFVGDVGKSSQDEFVLEQVLGLTSISAHALGLNSQTGQVAFPAACMLVLLDPKTNEQRFIESPSLRYISSVNFSEDGRLLAFGEHGIKPYVMVWLTREHREYSRFVVDNSVGIKAIHFHPKSTFMVILGCNDLNIGVWDYVRGRRLALTKWQTSPLGLTIPRPGTYVVVCGHRKVTLFKIDSVQSNMHETNVFQDRKAVLLGRQSEYTFVDITSGRSKHEKEVYTVTSCGFLCEIKMGDIIIDKATKVDARAYSVKYGVGHIFVGCCNGVVKICSPETLSVEASISINQMLESDSVLKLGVKNKYPGTMALVVNDKDGIVTCIFADYSIHAWKFNHMGDNMICSVITPISRFSHEDGGYESCIKEQFQRELMLRSFLGFSERIRGSKLYEKPTASDGVGAQHIMTHKSRFYHANAIKFSPEGKDVVCGNEEGEIKIYDAATGVLRRVIEAHSSHVTCIDLMYDDEYKLVCSGGRDRIIFVLNAKTDFSLVQVLCDHSAAITAVSLVHNSGLLTLVSAAADNVILIRRAIPGSALKFTITGEIAEATHNKSFNVTSEYIVTGSGNGGIKLWKADPVFSGKPTKTIKCEQKGVSGSRAIGIDPSGSFMAATQSPGQIIVYHMQTGQAVGSLTSQTDVTTLRFTDDLKYMISSTSNGCALVWRLPERMTEFMRCKQEKTNQTEMAREVSYDTYVSCLQVCNDTTYDDTHRTTDTVSSLTFGGSVSDVTPSIDSFSLLKLCPDMDASSRADDTVTSTMSYLSCSTCPETCSDTVYDYATSDSSERPIHLQAMTDKNVEESKCIRLGMFKYVSTSETNGLPDKFIFKSQTNKTAKSSESPESSRTFNNISKNNGKETSDDLRIGSMFSKPPKTDALNPHLPSINSKKRKIYSLSSVPQRKRSFKDKTFRKNIALALTSPSKCLRTVKGTSLISEENCYTTSSIFTTQSSSSKDYNSAFSPQFLTCSEMENTGGYWPVCSTPSTQSSSYLTTELPAEEALKNKIEQTFVITSGVIESKTLRKEDKTEDLDTLNSEDLTISAPLPKEENNIEVSNVNKKFSNDVANKMEEIEKADEEGSVNRLQDEAALNTDMFYDLEKSLSSHKFIQPSSREELKQKICDNNEDIHLRPSNENEGEIRESGKKSPVLLGENLSSDMLCADEQKKIKTRPQITCEELHVRGQDDSVTATKYVGASTATSREENSTADRRCSHFACLDEGTAFNYHTITRDEHGRLRWLGPHECNPCCKNRADHQVSATGENKVETIQDVTPLEIAKSPWNIKCSCCNSKTPLFFDSPEKASVLHKKQDAGSKCSSIELEQCDGSSYMAADAANISNEANVVQQKDLTDACAILLNPSQYVEHTLQCSQESIIDALRKWYCEIRQCFQLSNSQETFHRMYSDIDESELIELLVLALDSKSDEMSYEKDLGYMKSFNPGHETSKDRLVKALKSEYGEIPTNAVLVHLHTLLAQTLDDEREKSPQMNDTLSSSQGFFLQSFMPLLESAVKDNNKPCSSIIGLPNVKYKENGTSQLPYNCVHKALTVKDSSPERHQLIRSPILQRCGLTRVLYESNEKEQSSPLKRMSPRAQEILALIRGGAKYQNLTGDEAHKLDAISGQLPTRSEGSKVHFSAKDGSKSADWCKVPKPWADSEHKDSYKGPTKEETVERPSRAGAQGGATEQDTGQDTNRQSLVDIFKDQDEYLKKLKEVREKFEESIRALSNERQFRRSKADFKS